MKFYLKSRIHKYITNRYFNCLFIRKKKKKTVAITGSLHGEYIYVIRSTKYPNSVPNDYDFEFGHQFLPFSQATQIYRWQW